MYDNGTGVVVMFQADNDAGVLAHCERLLSRFSRAHISQNVPTGGLGIATDAFIIPLEYKRLFVSATLIS